MQRSFVICTQGPYVWKRPEYNKTDSHENHHQGEWDPKVLHDCGAHYGRNDARPEDCSVCERKELSTFL